MLRFCRALAWIAATFVAFAFAVTAAPAQIAYPDRPVKIIVPIGPGGSYDLVGRHLADVLSKRTGQAFFVENKPGAGTVVGTLAAAQSEPDGYTLLVGGLSNMAFNSALYSNLAYNPLRDFVPVALVYRFGYVMVGRKDLPQTTLSDIVAAAKANPGSITVATAGVGTGQHLVAAAFMKAAGVKFLEVPYKGSPPAFTDLLAGRIDLFFDSIAAALPYVQSGQARGIAVLSSKRSPLAPEVPTMSEAGLPGFESIISQGLFAPAGTPDDIVLKLNTTVNQIMGAKEMAVRAQQLKIEPRAYSSAEYKAWLTDQTVAWAKLTKDVGIKLE